MAAQALAIVCAWCNRRMAVAPAGTPITHTICPACLEWALTHPSYVPMPANDIGSGLKR